MRASEHLDPRGVAVACTRTGIFPGSRRRDHHHPSRMRAFWGRCHGKRQRPGSSLSSDSKRTRTRSARTRPDSGGISRERSQKRWRPTSPPCRRLAWWRLLGATPPAHQDGISPTGPAGSDDVTRALSASSLDGHAPRRSAPGSPLTHPLEHEHCRKPGTKFGGAVRWKRRRRRSFPVCPRPPGLGIPTGAAAAAAWTSETEFSVRMFRSSSWKKVGQAPINPELK